MSVGRQRRQTMHPESRWRDEMVAPLCEIVLRKMNCMRSIRRDAHERYDLRPTMWHPLDEIDPIIAATKWANSTVARIKLKKKEWERNEIVIRRKPNAGWSKLTVNSRMFGLVSRVVFFAPNSFMKLAKSSRDSEKLDISRFCFSVARCTCSWARWRRSHLFQFSVQPAASVHAHHG